MKKEGGVPPSYLSFTHYSSSSPPFSFHFPILPVLFYAPSPLILCPPPPSILSILFPPTEPPTSLYNHLSLAFESSITVVPRFSTAPWVCLDYHYSSVFPWLFPSLPPRSYSFFNREVVEGWKDLTLIR